MEMERIPQETNEESFQKQVEAKMTLWHEVIDEAKIDKKTKAAFKEILESFRDWEIKKAYNSIGDAIYYTLHRLLNAVGNEPHKEEAQALYENLREEIWSFLTPEK